MESISDDETYAVSEIIAQRKRKGVLEYLVSWKGSVEDTWEPAKTISTDCDAAVKVFTEKQKASRSKSKSRSKSRTRSSSRSRKAATAGKSSRSRSRGRPAKAKPTEVSPKPEAENKEENTAVRRSARQLKRKEDTQEVKVIETVVTESSSNHTMADKNENASGRVLRSSTTEKRDELEVQRVHNDQRPVREDDSKPRSPIWKVADYIVIILFVVSLMAAIFLFVEKFVDLDSFKKQAFPSFQVLKTRLSKGCTQVEDIGRAALAYVYDGWLHVLDHLKITQGQSAAHSSAKAVPK